MVDSGVPPDIAAMSFEDALAELEQIVRRLEGGQVKLDEAIRLTSAARNSSGIAKESSTRRSKGSIESSSAPTAPSPRSPRNLTDTLWSHPIPFAKALDEAAKVTDAAIERLLTVPPGLEARVYDAMRYSALAPGKRLRPFLVFAGRSLFGVARRCASRSRQRSRWSMPIPWCTTICRRWTTAICGAAARPATSNSTKRPRCSPGMGC